MGLSNGLGIQHMGVGCAVEAADTGEARVVAVFIHVGRIQCIGRLMIVLRKPPGQHDAQLCGVFAAADSGFGIVIKLLVDDRDAAGLGAGAAAAADKHIDIGGVYPFFLQHIQDHLVTERHLAVHVGELQQNRRVMELAFLEQFLFVYKEADFGGGGTGIDDQDFKIHNVFQEQGKGIRFLMTESGISCTETGNIRPGILNPSGPSVTVCPAKALREVRHDSMHWN